MPTPIAKGRSHRPQPWTVMLVLALAMPAPARAQIIRGQVVGVGDGQPISDATLILRDSDGEVRGAAISREDGRFLLHSDQPALVRLEVRHLGYADWTTANFALSSGEVIDVEVRLGIEAIPLEAITVLAHANTSAGRLAGFEERRNNPGGSTGFYLTEDDIATRAAATPSSLVLAAPGMSVARAGSGTMDRSVIRSGDCIARTFIDGVRFNQSESHTVDDLLTPDLIAGVEVYPRPLSAPAQYQDVGSDCGVVLFWTKEPRPSVGSSWTFARVAVGIGVLAGILTLGFGR